MKNYNEFYPKPRTGQECKKTDCDRYKNYSAWQCGTSSLEFCMCCKHAHVSQYKRRAPDVNSENSSKSSVLGLTEP